MNQTVPWQELEQLIAPHYPKPGQGRRAYPLCTMLRIHFLQQWFSLSDPAAEEALHDVPAYSDFCQIDVGNSTIPDETTILLFRRLLERHQLADAIFERINTVLEHKGLLLKQGTAIDATLIAAPSSTKNKDGKRDPDMHSTQKGDNWHFGMKAHIGVDMQSGVVHSVKSTAANVHDVTMATQLLHGQERIVSNDSGYRGLEQRDDYQQWLHEQGRQNDAPQMWTSMTPSKRKTLKQRKAHGCQVSNTIDQLEHLKASARSLVEHPFRVIKRQFGHVKARYKGMAKNAAQVKTLFALSNIWMMRHRLMEGAPG